MKARKGTQKVGVQKKLPAPKTKMTTRARARKSWLPKTQKARKKIQVNLSNKLLQNQRHSLAMSQRQQATCLSKKKILRTDATFL